MANKKYSRKTSEERLAEIKELSMLAVEQMEKYQNSPKELLEYAEFMSRFYNYSLNNQQLIQNQFDGAIAVASYKDWKEKGYSVTKGEKGIKILTYTPVTLFKDKEGNEKSITEATEEEKELIKNKILTSRKIPCFKVGHVFDVSQTNARLEDLPKIFPNRQYDFKIEGENNIEYLKKGIKAVSCELNIDIRDMKESRFGFSELGAAKGAFIQSINSSEKEIVLNSRNTETQNIATAIHELAHARLHNNSLDNAANSKPTKEFQAELTSFIVCKHYGMDTSEKAIPYISQWTKNGIKLEEKQKAMEEVHRTCKEFISTIDNIIQKEQERDQNMEKTKTIDMTEKKLSIYQLKPGENNRDRRWISYDQLLRQGENPEIENYKNIGNYHLYCSESNHSQILEEIYTTFNIDKPSDFNGHSLSVSDIIVIEDNGKVTASYVDDIGFVNCPEFKKQHQEIVKNLKQDKDKGKEIDNPDKTEAKKKAQMMYKNRMFER
ncbi:uncharacterized protein DUF955 [Alkalibaculum bacchi]|uniref:Uncharacterized protein DUF955 n=1 Tax=Alkalibaculum bacchi TaxID=645887 RepID=A0A366HYX4_9FIRM|nr:YodL domain-containing protein [Alkalibaculum bacchi]RBP59326.1 uncharacterized protein DUF955 [Alkalibaculum bacchi]